MGISAAVSDAEAPRSEAGIGAVAATLGGRTDFRWLGGFRRLGRDYIRLAEVVVGWHWLAFLVLLGNQLGFQSREQASASGESGGGPHRPLSIINAALDAFFFGRPFEEGFNSGDLAMDAVSAPSPSDHHLANRLESLRTKFRDHNIGDLIAVTSREMTFVIQLLVVARM